MRIRHLIPLLLLLLLLAACQTPATPAATPTPQPTNTPTPEPTSTPKPTDTPTPPPTPTPQSTPTPSQESVTPQATSEETVRIQKQQEGFLVQDVQYQYQLLLPGDDWIPFLPTQESIDQIMGSAHESLPNVDVSGIAALMKQVGAQFRLYAFYTGQEGRDANFVTNINVITTPLDRGYDMTVVAEVNKKQLLETFPGSQVLDEQQITNAHGVRVGMVTIKNPILTAGDEPFPLAQTFIYSQTPEHVLISMTFSTPLNTYETLKPLIQAIADSIQFTP